MSAEELILQHREGACLTVTINRPEKANSLTRDMLIQLRDVFLVARQDDSLHVVILTGAGERVFCGGADLATLYDDTDGSDPWEEMAQALRAIPVLTISAINGPCMGGGLTLALSCDIRIGVETARFAYPALKNNVLPAQYDVDQLKRLMGPGRAATILLGGDTVLADDALAWGLLDKLAARTTLMDSCQELCATAISADRNHLARLKAMLKEDAS